MVKGFSQDSSKNEDQDKNSSLLDRSLLTLPSRSGLSAAWYLLIMRFRYSEDMQHQLFVNIFFLSVLEELRIFSPMAQISHTHFGGCCLQKKNDKDDKHEQKKWAFAL